MLKSFPKKWIQHSLQVWEKKSGKNRQLLKIFTSFTRWNFAHHSYWIFHMIFPNEIEPFQSNETILIGMIEFISRNFINFKKFWMKITFVIFRNQFSWKFWPKWADLIWSKLNLFWIFLWAQIFSWIYILL